MAKISILDPLPITHFLHNINITYLKRSFFNTKLIPRKQKHILKQNNYKKLNFFFPLHIATENGHFIKWFFKKLWQLIGISKN